MAQIWNMVVSHMNNKYKYSGSSNHVNDTNNNRNSNNNKKHNSNRKGSVEINDSNQ